MAAAAYQPKHVDDGQNQVADEKEGKVRIVGCLVVLRVGQRAQFLCELVRSDIAMPRTAADLNRKDDEHCEPKEADEQDFWCVELEQRALRPPAAVSQTADANGATHLHRILAHAIKHDLCARAGKNRPPRNEQRQCEIGPAGVWTTHQPEEEQHGDKGHQHKLRRSARWACAGDTQTRRRRRT